MFDNLLKLIQENAGEAIISNPAIPNERNDEAMQVAGNGIVDHLKGLANSGGMEKVISMFKQDNKGTEVNAISNNVAESLMKQFGIDSSQAGGIVGKLIPVVMDQFVSKTNDKDDSSFDLGDIVSSLGGNQTGGMMDKLKGLFN